MFIQLTFSAGRTKYLGWMNWSDIWNKENIESELALDLETTKVKSISADAIHNNIEDEQ